MSHFKPRITQTFGIIDVMPTKLRRIGEQTKKRSPKGAFIIVPLSEEKGQNKPT